ncbi:MAG: response regulator, partial [Natronomonas sp.]
MAVRVLHVDNEPGFAEMVATFLERESDMSVQTATNAADGLDRLDEEEFDCIVSGYEMPGQNGIEFL